MLIIFLFLYDYSLTVSGFLIWISFVVFLSPIIFVVFDDILHPFIVCGIINFFALLHFLYKDLVRSDITYLGKIPEEQFNFILQYSVIIIIVWYLFFYLGYYLMKKTQLVEFDFFEIKKTSFIPTVLMILAILAFSYALYINNGFIGMLNSMTQRVDVYAGRAYLRYMVLVGGISPFLLLAFGKKTISIINLIFIMFLTILFGSRGLVIFKILLPYLIFYNYIEEEITVIKVLPLILGLLFFIVLWQEWRFTGNINFDFNNLENIFIKIIKDRNMANILPALIGRLHFDDLEYLFGTPLINIFAAPIPRGVWPGKPIIAYSGIVGKALLGNNFWGLPPGNYGWAYFNFSWIGVILLGFATGIIIRIIYEILVLKKSSNYISIAFYSFTVMTFNNIFTTDAQISVLWFLGVFILIYLFDKINLKIKN